MKEYKTRSRTLILDYLKENADRRFTVGDIYKQINESDSGINRATVYRNLDRLCQQGKLLRYKDTDSDACYYQYSDEHDNCDSHLHAKCSECGKIFHIESEFAREFEGHMQSEYGIDVDCSKTIIVGKCDECK